MNEKINAASEISHRYEFMKENIIFFFSASEKSKFMLKGDHRVKSNKIIVIYLLLMKIESHTTSDTFTTVSVSSIHHSELTGPEH